MLYITRFIELDDDEEGMLLDIPIVPALRPRLPLPPHPGPDMEEKDIAGIEMDPDVDPDIATLPIPTLRELEYAS